ncbi:hypothetical protein LCGC14_0531310 [marine sediment metagenome]|uniref:Uncharacterized protein n=1 Tax=marine sediment metagenome TaxID=412755 RepID=A0A0F9RVK8_9ZZZZ
MSEKYKISFEVEPEEAKDNVLRLLGLLRVNGIIGASRILGILDPISKEEKEFSCFFDGDGNHRLDNIKIEKL